MKNITLAIIFIIFPFLAYSQEEPKYFLDILNGSFHRIDLNGRMGKTGYIDFLTCQDFPKGQSVVTFIDKFGRSGFAIRYTTEVLDYKDAESKPKLLADTTKVKVTAFFERQENNNNGVWVTGVLNPFPSLSDGVYYNYGAQNQRGIYARHIKDLINNGELDFQHNSEYFDENTIPLAYNHMFPDETVLRTEITIRSKLVTSCDLGEEISIKVPKDSNTTNLEHREL